MFLAIVLWIVGWLFTVGLSWEAEFEGEDFLTNLIDGAIALVLWAFLLGQEINKRFPRVRKGYQPPTESRFPTQP